MTRYSCRRWSSPSFKIGSCSIWSKTRPSFSPDQCFSQFEYWSKQERLEFLYDSGLAVGRPGGSDNFKEAFTKAEEPSSFSATATAKEASSSSVLGLVVGITTEDHQIME